MNSVADVVYIVSDALCFTRYSLADDLQGFCLDLEDDNF